MTLDDILKLKAVSLYILKQCGETDFIHLFKILYFAERSHFASYGKHLVKDTFCALERGPVPSFLYDAMKVTTGSASAMPGTLLADLSKAFKPGEAECRYIVRAAEEPDMDELSKAEIASLNSSIKENYSKSTQQLSKDSHDLAWKKAWEHKNASPMNPLLIAEAGGSTSEFLKYLKEQEELDKYLSD